MYGYTLNIIVLFNLGNQLNGEHCRYSNENRKKPTIIIYLSQAYELKQWLIDMRIRKYKVKSVTPKIVF